MPTSAKEFRLMGELQIFREDAVVFSAQRFDAYLTVNAAAPIFAEHFPIIRLSQVLASLVSSATVSPG
jgi:hypothetical protein